MPRNRFEEIKANDILSFKKTSNDAPDRACVGLVSHIRDIRYITEDGLSSEWFMTSLLKESSVEKVNCDFVIEFVENISKKFNERAEEIGGLIGAIEMHRKFYNDKILHEMSKTDNPKQLFTALYLLESPMFWYLSEAKRSNTNVYIFTGNDFRITRRFTEKSWLPAWGYENLDVFVSKIEPHILANLLKFELCRKGLKNSIPFYADYEVFEIPEQGLKYIPKEKFSQKIEVLIEGFNEQK